MSLVTRAILAILMLASTAYAQGSSHVSSSTINPSVRSSGIPFTIKAFSGSWTPSAVTATLPPQTVVAFQGRNIPALGTLGNNGQAYPTASNNTRIAIDRVDVVITGPANVASTVNARLSRRSLLYASNQGAAPAAGIAPVLAAVANAASQMGTGIYTYNYAAVDSFGGEGNCSPTNTVNVVAGQGVTVTLPAVPAGAIGYNVYRGGAGNGQGGFLDRTRTTTYNDVAPDSQGVNSRGTFQCTTSGPYLPWGTVPIADPISTTTLAGSGNGNGYPNGGELVLEVQRALGVAPTRMVVTEQPGGFVRSLVIAPAAALGTRYRVSNTNEASPFIGVHTVATQLARDLLCEGGGSNNCPSSRAMYSSSFMANRVWGFNISDAAIGGAFTVWNYEVYGYASANVPVQRSFDNLGAFVGVLSAGIGEGSVLTMQWANPPTFHVNDEVTIDIGSTASTAAITLAVYISGRSF